MGFVPDADQRAILDAAFALRSDYTPACFEVVAVAPRQNLKTAALELAALTDLFVFEEELHTWTAHRFDTAQKTYQHMKQLIRSNPDYKRRVKFHDANGDEAIELLPDGQRIEFHARSTGKGRGTTGRKITLDEALFLSPNEIGDIVPTLATAATAQVRYASSAGLARSAVLRALRNRGRKGGDASLAYFEWCAPVVDCATAYCGHFVGVPGCALDDMDLLRLANPALGRRITEERLGQFRRAMPPEEFAREFLGWWEDPPDEGGQAMPADDWAACLDVGSKFGPGPSAFGVHLTGDRSTAFVAGAGLRADGLPHVEVLAECRPSQAVDQILDLHRRRSAAVVIDPGSHAGSLIQPLEDAGLEVVQVTLQKLAAACGVVYDAVVSHRLRHIGQTQLDTAVHGSSTRAVSRDAWVWKGQASTPLVAATLALHGSGIATETEMWGFYQ